MPSLDFYTLTIVTVVSMLLAGVALSVVHSLNTGCEGIRRCVGACVLFFLGFACFPLRSVIPGKFMILVSNFPLFAAAMFLLDGIISFREFRRPVKLYIAGACVYAAMFCWFVFGDDDFNARVAVDGIFLSVPGLLAAGIMAWKVPMRDRAVYWSTAAGFGMHGISILTRGLIAVFGQPFLADQPRTIDYLNLATLNLAAIGCAFGLAMATNLRLQRRTEKLALYDALTNLPNRRMFEERLEVAERNAFASGGRIALIYCDIDDFKGINDTLGHEGGDRALRIVAERLRGLVDEDVCLARIGGDEFLVLMENAPARESVLALIDRLRDGVEGDIDYDGQCATVRISCGVAIFPDDVGSASDLIRLADAGMYMVKQHGRFAAEEPMRAYARPA